jgi:hypothetical protein
MRRTVAWVVANPALALALASATAFGYVRLAYFLFLSPLNVTPNDVGIGYKETLSDSFGTLVWSATFAVSAMLVGVALGLVGKGYGAIRRKPSQQTWSFWLFDGLSSCLFAYLLFLLLMAHYAGQNVEHGKAAEMPKIWGIPAFSLDASRVKVASTEAAIASAVSPTDCVYYLGASGSTTVLYRPATGSTIRVPSAGVTLSTTKQQACQAT